MNDSRCGSELCMWVVYDRPSDAPTEIVARLFKLDRATEVVVRGNDLDEVRTLIQSLNPGSMRMLRHPDDEPHIVEVWF